MSSSRKVAAFCFFFFVCFFSSFAGDFFPHLIVHQGGSCIIKKRTIVFAIRRDLSRASKVPSLVGTAEESRVLWYSFVCCAFFF
jgi:hypothetical protein